VNAINKIKTFSCDCKAIEDISADERYREIILHDKALCMKANATQHLLEDEGREVSGAIQFGLVTVLT